MTFENNASAFDVEYGALKLTTDQIISRLAEIQRSDGALKNAIVTADSLALGLLNTIAGISYVYTYNIFGGAIGSVPYQAAPDITAFVTPGTPGAVFTCSGAGAPSWTTSVGSGNFVRDTGATLNSPIFTAPVLGTPSSGSLANCTGLPVDAGTTGTLPVSRGGTGTTTSTGGGPVVLAISPALQTPDLGTPSAGVLSNCTNLPLTSGTSGVLPVAKGGTNITSWANGQIPIGRTSDGSLQGATITPGAGVSVTNGAGSITISAVGGLSPATTQTLVAGGALLNTTSDTLIVTDGTNVYALPLANIIVSGDATATGQVLAGGGA
jgi:hypothetical protein